MDSDLALVVVEVDHYVLLVVLQDDHQQEVLLGCVVLQKGMVLHFVVGKAELEVVVMHVSWL